MAYEALIDHISFGHDPVRGEDGAVWLLVLGEPNENVVCRVHPRRAHHYERQAFRRGAAGHRLNATPEEIAEDRAHVWGWDGNTEAPTLTPSFLAEQGRPYRLHSYVRAGTLDVLSDSTCTLSHATPCWDVWDTDVKER